MLDFENIIQKNLQIIRDQITAAEIKYKREKGSVLLLAASKTQSAEKIRAAISAGQVCFGENYLQEALEKISALKEFSLEWHFIGNIQSNKTKLIAENFSWVQSVSSLKIAQRLNAQRPAELPPLNVCIEVNVDQEKTKSGIVINNSEIKNLQELALQILQCKKLRLRGLMAIPEPTQDSVKQENIFKKIAEIQQKMIAAGLPLDTLSMGMTDDFEAAIAAGSTLVRIGTGIFGKRGH